MLTHGGRAYQPRGAAAAARAGRHHPAAAAADQRRVGPHLPDLRRRPAPRLPQHRPHPRPVQEDREGTDPRRRHVRHRVDRPVVAGDRPDLRPQAARRGDQEDLGRRPRPKDILETPEGCQGPPEVRYRAHVAFSTAYDIMGNLEQVHNRRKAFIYVSNGYDFNPFAKHAAPRTTSSAATAMIGRRQQSERRRRQQQLVGLTIRTRSAKQGNQFAEADLASELGGADARRQPRQRHDLHHRPARPGRRPGSRRGSRHGGLAELRHRVAEQPARPRRADRRLSRSSTRTTSPRRSSASTRRRATTTSSATTRATRTRRRSAAASTSRSRGPTSTCCTAPSTR